jgi:hypothetical protein
LDHTSGCNVDIRYPASAPSTTSAGSPSIASDGDQIEVAHAKAIPFAPEWQAARAAATVLEGCDNLCAGLIFADCSRAEDPDIVFIQRACALAIHDGLANDLVGHGQFPSAVRGHSLPLLRWPQLQSLSWISATLLNGDGCQSANATPPPKNPRHPDWCRSGHPFLGDEPHNRLIRGSWARRIHAVAVVLTLVKAAVPVSASSTKRVSCGLIHFGG